MLRVNVFLFREKTQIRPIYRSRLITPLTGSRGKIPTYRRGFPPWDAGLRLVATYRPSEPPIIKTTIEAKALSSLLPPKWPIPSTKLARDFSGHRLTLIINPSIIKNTQLQITIMTIRSSNNLSTITPVVPRLILHIKTHKEPWSTKTRSYSAN